MLRQTALTSKVSLVDMGYRFISTGSVEPGRIAAICPQQSLFKVGPDVPAERLASHHSSVESQGSSPPSTTSLYHCLPSFPLLSSWPPCSPHFISTPSPPVFCALPHCPASFYSQIIAPHLSPSSISSLLINNVSLWTLISCHPLSFYIIFFFCSPEKKFLIKKKNY